MYFDSTMIFLIPGLILGLWAQNKVRSAYQKYSGVLTGRGVPACTEVRELLSAQNAGYVNVTKVQGQLTDHFDPQSDTLRLSEGVYDSASVAALGIPAHEAGHALQKQENYVFLSLRTLLVPTVNIGSKLSWPIFLAGLVFSWEPLMTAGIILFLLAVGFSLITLPVEFDASRRALRMLEGSGRYTQDELTGAKKVLSAAAMTYVASFISVLMQLVRLLVLAGNNRRRN